LGARNGAVRGQRLFIGPVAAARHSARVETLGGLDHLLQPSRGYDARRWSVALLATSATDVHADLHTVIYAYSHTNTNTDTDTDTDANTDTNANILSKANTDTHTQADGHANVDTDTHADTNTDTHANADTHAHHYFPV
jgi:hypothetical protein